MTSHTGSCHCGGIKFEVDGEIDSGLACNCSICSRKGSLLWFVPRARLKLKTPESAASTYTFTVEVQDGCNTVTRTFDITVNAASSIADWTTLD